ncbi:DinB family protein [Stackebrandtia endophytica]
MDHSGDVRRARFIDANLAGARFIRCDLSGAVMRAVDVDGAEIDAPWLTESDGRLLVNDVDVAPYVEAELNLRFPGRDQRRSDRPDDLQNAWAAVEAAWTSTVKRAASMPEGTVEISVDGEWSFAQTLRHLVMATDTWLRRAVLEIEEPYHPIGLPHAEYETDGYDLSVFTADHPDYTEVTAARTDRMTMVRDFLATTTSRQLAEPRRSPWAPDHRETVLSCVHTILNEEWEHLRYALRDLDKIKEGGG